MTAMNPPFALATAEFYGPKTGAFSLTGDMTAARRHHTATLLADGTVLIAGGTGADSAELYDPSTGAFIVTGKMATPLVSHTATLLHDGRVLISGGFGVGGSPANAEVYDPSTGTFAATGAYARPNTCDFCPPATLLADGKVLFTPPAQLWDPATGAFSVTGPLIYASHSTSTLLSDGKVLLAG